MQPRARHQRQQRQSQLAKTMKRPARSRITRRAGLPPHSVQPPRIASTTCSRRSGARRARVRPRQRATAPMTGTKLNAFTKNRAAALLAAYSAPPIAGPIARLRFWLTAPSAIACVPVLRRDELGLQRLPRRRGQRLPGADGEDQREQHPRRHQPAPGRAAILDDPARKPGRSCPGTRRHDPDQVLRGELHAVHPHRAADRAGHSGKGEHAATGRGRAVPRRHQACPGLAAIDPGDHPGHRGEAGMAVAARRLGGQLQALRPGALLDGRRPETRLPAVGLASSTTPPTCESSTPPHRAAACWRRSSS